ncbi:hypothetical protein [Arcobacter porcinus]|uniref:hypothetical protein n=1 Tax=Arcobacter porcinus TaxID=1935204 RepID=UPI00081E8C87|nr:hypothetical protein [Arcobacter porcinus]OCL81592.1 hypothetical protein AAW29_01851 [Arcobacter porcinus]
MLNKDIDEVSSGNLYVLDGNKKKIYPFIFEDLNDSYNIERFPDRVRRKPKAKRIYNYFANIYIILGYKYFEYKNFQKGSIDEIANLIHDRVAVSKGSIKVKISQLKASIGKDEITCSYDLIKMYKRFKMVSYRNLEDALFNNEENLILVRKKLDILEDNCKQEEKKKMDEHELSELMKNYIKKQNIEKQSEQGYYVSKMIDL